MAAATFVAANISADQTMGSIIRNQKALSAVTLGACAYIDTADLMALADADVTVAEARALGIVVSSASEYGETTIAAGAYGSICIFGPVYGFSGLVPGTVYWVGKTAGQLVDAAPTTGAFVQIMGRAIATDVFFVDPNMSAPASV